MLLPVFLKDMHGHVLENIHRIGCSNQRVYKSIPSACNSIDYLFLKTADVSPHELCSNFVY